LGSGRALRLTSDAGQDLVSCFGPNEGPGIFVVHVDVLAAASKSFTVRNTARSNSLVGEFGKPSLHQVDPGTVGRGEVDMKSWAFRKPFPDHGGFVRSVVIRDDMDIQSGGHVRLDHIEGEIRDFWRALEAVMDPYQA
jgi:hypothetical protein